MKEMGKNILGTQRKYKQAHIRIFKKKGSSNYILHVLFCYCYLCLLKRFLFEFVLLVVFFIFA